MTFPALHAAGLLAASGTTAYVLCRVARDAARRRGLLDLPNERSSHVAPTPRVGGVGIVGAMLAASMPAVWWMEAEARSSWLIVLTIGVAVSLVSLIDDMRGHLSARVRLLVHFCAAAALLTWGGQIATVALAESWAGSGAAGWWLLVLAALWVVGFLNAFNFMDGIDGIAATQALVAGLGWCLLGKLASDGGAMLAGSIIAGAAAGFLVLNWAPATLFMGDVGSAFLGFTLAAMPLVADDTPRLAIPAVLMVWPFVFDASLTFLRRLARGENVFAAHRSHLYQRLTAVGWSHARVTTLYLVLDAIGVVAAVLWLQGGLGVLAASVLVVSGAVGLWLIVSRNERRFDSSTAAVVGLRRTEDHGRA